MKTCVRVSYLLQNRGKKKPLIYKTVLKQSETARPKTESVSAKLKIQHDLPVVQTRDLTKSQELTSFYDGVGFDINTMSWVAVSRYFLLLW